MVRKILLQKNPINLLLSQRIMETGLKPSTNVRTDVGRRQSLAIQQVKNEMRSLDLEGKLKYLKPQILELQVLMIYHHQ